MNELLKRKLEFEKSWPELYKKELKQKETCLKLWQGVYKGSAKQKDAITCEEIYDKLKKRTNNQMDELIKINKQLMDISLSK